MKRSPLSDELLRLVTKVMCLQDTQTGVHIHCEVKSWFLELVVRLGALQERYSVEAQYVMKLGPLSDSAKTQYIISRELMDIYASGVDLNNRAASVSEIIIARCNELEDNQRAQILFWLSQTMSGVLTSQLGLAGQLTLPDATGCSLNLLSASEVSQMTINELMFPTLADALRALVHDLTTRKGELRLSRYGERLNVEFETDQGTVLCYRIDVASVASIRA